MELNRKKGSIETVSNKTISGRISDANANRTIGTIKTFPLYESEENFKNAAIHKNIATVVNCKYIKKFIPTTEKKTINVILKNLGTFISRSLVLMIPSEIQWKATNNMVYHSKSDEML